MTSVDDQHPECAFDIQVAAVLPRLNNPTGFKSRLSMGWVQFSDLIKSPSGT